MPESAVRRLMDDPAGDDPTLWLEVARIAGDDEPAAVAATLEVLGERLYVGPYLSSLMAKALVPEAGGRVAVAAADESGTLTAAGVTVAADGRVTSSRSFVLDGMSADQIIVFGLRDGIDCVVAIEA